MGVVPRELRSGRVAVPGVCGSTEVRRGVCIPDGVDVPLVFPVADEVLETLDVCLTGIRERWLLFGSPISVGMLDERLMPPFLVGAGDAAPDAVLEETPFVWVVVVVVVVVPRALVLVEPTESRDGRGVVVLVILRVGMRDGVASSVLSSDSVDPCRDGGFEPARLAGRELGRELAREPPGVI